MSVLALLSGKSTSDERILRTFNDAMLNLQVDAFGKRDALGVTDNDVRYSCQLIGELLQRTSELLIDPTNVPTDAPNDRVMQTAAQTLVEKLEQRGRPISDWLEDIAHTRARLATRQTLCEDDWILLEAFMDVFDEELARDLQELTRYF